MAVWGGLTNSLEKKRSKRKEEKERYKHLNAEFQRIARRDKKAFLSGQCKEIEENNRMGKQSCPSLCDPMNRSTPGLPVHHRLPEFTQAHVHPVSDTIQPSHPLSSPSPPAPNPSQHQGLFQWVNSLHEVAKELKFQLQHQSFQWTLRTDLL